MYKRLAVLLAIGWLCVGQAVTATPIVIPTVPVGNTGNLPDDTGFGAVDYAYRIGTTEVTNAQYAAFLNAKAASDPLGLYSTGMGSSVGGIARSGADGSYSYTPISGREDMPVNFIVWFTAIRFTNWLHNGQGTGDTETGAYTLLGGTPIPSNASSIARHPGATWFLPSEDEWYKAAYHKNDGDTGNYFEYPTSSDTAPIAEAPAGGSNSANYNDVVGDLTTVGAYVDSTSPYGTFDQGGNVWEWNESLFPATPVDRRGMRGGAAFFDRRRGLGLSASSLHPNFLLTLTRIDNGFRVATVPEPSSAALAGLGVVWLSLTARSYRRKNRRDGPKK